VADLAFEDEEAGILDATSGVGMDLMVEDSGNAERLGELLGFLGRVDVLHLSCHGALEPKPVLLLEDDLGGRAPATADELDSALQPHRPRLLFLSACETAGADRLLGSLAATLVRRGVPALLGWGGSVRDDQAIRFATELYQRLSRQGRLDESVAWARLELLSESSGRFGDWHLPRLFLGAPGGGALVSGYRKRTVKDRRKVLQKTFLDARGKVPVASPEEFVGRRQDLQRILRAYRDGALGVLVHGIGRQGKSSLALRVVQRLPDHRPIVLYGPFDGSALLDAIAEAVAEPAARDFVEKNREASQKENFLADVLVKLLETYCAQSDERRKPLLFVLDDFEQLLEPDSVPPRRLQARFVEPVQALIRALERAETDSKLLITSRYTFTLPWQGRDLAESLISQPLPGMSENDRRKQLRTKLRLLSASAVKREISDRLLAAARGNPGLQDLLTVLLVEAPERAERALSQMEAHLAGQEGPEAEEVVAFLSQLALEGLISLLSPAERELLRISTLFQLPIPEALFAVLAPGAGLSIPIDQTVRHLVGLGLWEIHSPESDESFLVSELVRPYAGPLSLEEQKNHAERAVRPLFEAWGNFGGGQNRTFSQDLELTRLALLAEDAEIVAVCAEDALTALERRLQNRQAAELGRDAVALLDEKAREVPLGLLRKTAELCQLIGDTSTARVFYERANLAITDALAKGLQIDPIDHAAVLISHSRLLEQDGQINEALRGFEQARDLLSKAGDLRSRAVTLSDIARIKFSRGEVDDALTLLQEILRVFESLGYTRERAVALGDIARIKVSRGEVDDALTLHQEKLRINESLGDLRSRAVTLGDIARIKVSRGEVDNALTLHEEKLRVNGSLGDLRERAVTLGDIARIKLSRGKVDDALTLYDEMQKIFESLGDLEGKANSLWSLAQIDFAQGALTRAVERLGEAYQITLRLGQLDGTCAVGWDLGRLLCSTGALAEGRLVLEHSLAGLRRLRRDAMAQEVQDYLEALPPSPPAFKGAGS
jgi:tetratricopeptide (TPR) repeat protein